MPASKIVDEKEVIQWMREGRTYKWIVEQYKIKYNVETTVSMWGNFRRSKKLPRRISRNDDLIPWFVREEHRLRYPVAMLRLEARVRDGRPITEVEQKRLDLWKRSLEEDNAVVHYDPDTDEGFFHVPREETDDDLIRRPAEKTTPRPNTDSV